MRFKKFSKDIFEFLLVKKKYNLKTDPSKAIYPVDLDFTLDDEVNYYHPFDENGIPMKIYSSKGKQYNPTRIASYGFAHWGRYQTNGKEIHKNAFMNVLCWFCENNQNGLWFYEFEWNDLEKYWISCMAQGEGISILTRGYLLTSDEKYINLAIKAIEPFKKTIKDKGVVSYVNDDSIFFEEYPTDKPVHVLNGFLYSLIGLIEFKEVLEKLQDRKLETRELSKLINNAVTSLEKNIDRWDAGFWSYYDLHLEGKKVRNISTIIYHMLHVTQLKFIAHKTNNSYLMHISTKWEKYLINTNYRIKALMIKILYRIKNHAQR
ncbi:D-glucuronyl C5-epimerase family protein [Bacillus sp. FJAT-22090]|uniref:D-glucuronyl C5-epimerase family protein n=1 Tax=Bacillus sp. FJAT-22090 TaxID=1581038 RepID=UPI0011A49D88|nr:D-glucuronyl C5-epimerase family protein [Bacillus sp. FJAT-22090]